MDFEFKYMRKSKLRIEQQLSRNIFIINTNQYIYIKKYNFKNIFTFKRIKSRLNNVHHKVIFSHNMVLCILWQEAGLRNFLFSHI